MNYFIVATLCIIALVIGILSLKENELLSRHRRNKFILLAFIIIIEIFIDTVSITLDGMNKDLIELYKIIKVIEFCITPLILSIFSGLVTSKKFWGNIKKYFLVLIFINVSLQVINFFVPITFTIDENAVYHRSSLGCLYLIILVACFVLLIVSINNPHVKNSTEFSATFYLTTVLIILGIVIRFLYEKSNSDWLCITLSYFVFIIYFNNNYFKMDSTTSLLNRKAFDRKIVRVDYETAIIVVDANHFKKVNDEYGHQSGDYALEKIAEAILNLYGKIGYCYRIGGDEFCIILKPKVLQSLLVNDSKHSVYNVLNELTESLDKDIAEKSKKCALFKYGVSQGYDIYRPISSFSVIDKYRSIEEVFKQADKNMYKQKELNNSNTL